MTPAALKSVLVAIMLVWLVSACTDSAHRDPSPRILAMGDSLLAWNRLSNRSVADYVSAILSEPVVDRSVSGAHIIYNLPISGSMGLRIGSQFQAGSWDWVILNGGGNDLWLGCGCVRCANRMDRLISEDGVWGEIPALVAGLRSKGAQVVYLGYLRSPGFGSPIEHCRPAGDELDRRLARMAATDPGIHFVSIADLVPYGDTGYHAIDHIHPSPKGSAAIGQRIADVIASRKNR